MSYLAALILGIVQGLTEFLPISSTAHVGLTARALGLPDDGMAAFTAVIQLGTLLAVLAYFARDLYEISAATLDALVHPARLKAALGLGEAAAGDPDRALKARLGLFIVLGTIPIGLCGVVLKHFIEGKARTLPVIAASLIVLAVVLFLAERLARHRRDLASVGIKDALVIGAAQALALIPGVSRSGVTLTAALFMGLRRDDAARYSFLLSVPAVLAAAIFEMKDAVRSPTLTQNGIGVILVGTAAAFVVGYASIAWLMRFLRTRTTLPFVAYRVALGAAIIGLLAGGVIHDHPAPPRHGAAAAASPAHHR
ncbi:MAG TPA: undecaprenyl-diphosphatase UppP [Polyangia bacterium]